MPSWINDVLTALEPWWPFTVKLLVFWFVGQNMKKRVFTKARAQVSPFMAAARDTMWLHPSIAGVVWGLLFPWMPSISFVTSRGGAVTEGLAAGVVSVLGFILLERAAEHYRWTWLLKAIHDVGTDRPSVPSGPPSDPPPPVPA